MHRPRQQPKAFARKRPHKRTCASPGGLPILPIVHRGRAFWPAANFESAACSFCGRRNGLGISLRDDRGDSSKADRRRAIVAGRGIEQ